MSSWDLFTGQTDKASSVARQIVFALAAVSWGSLYNEGEVKSHSPIFMICVIFVIIYFVIDMLQYYISARMLRQLEYNYLIAKVTNNNLENINKKYAAKRIEIEKLSYKFFTLKIMIIPVLVILIFIQYISLLVS